MSRLALGTVQFGLNYGIANRQGQVPLAEARSILEYAASMGMDTLDTAIAYGESEQRLGGLGVRDWRIVSKLPALPDSCPDVRVWVRQSVEASLQSLRIERLHGLLLHRPEDLLGGCGAVLYEAMRELVADGQVGKIGLSVYSPEEFLTMSARFAFDLVQIPFNFIDRRFIDSGLYWQLLDRGTEVHVRSVFLQGLLLLSAAERPPQFRRWQSLWQHWQNWLSVHDLTPLEACIRYPLSFEGIARVVVGVDSLVQLREIVRAADGLLPAIPTELSCADPDLVIPSRWANI